MRTHQFKLASLFLFAIFMGVCSDIAGIEFPKDMETKPHLMRTLLPIPSSVQFEDDFFSLSSRTVIYFDSNHPWLEPLALQLKEYIAESMGIMSAVHPSSDLHEDGIHLQSHSADILSDPEAYRLVIEKDKILIHASQAKGIFYGLQTLRQLILTQLINTPGVSTLQISCGRIEDRPAYRWRGLLLDSARHFLSVNAIKRYIDIIAFHKMNVLHLHLTDDQGWRVESKKYPELNRVGSFRGQDENRYGGYYTHEELREIVRYAESRYIEVVPEFEMPGHASAAVASYPHLSCHGRKIDVVTQWGVFEDVFCPGKETTFEFLQGVLEEWLEVFPSLYVHIGGDEAPRSNWKVCKDCEKRMQEESFDRVDDLQGYLIRRIERFLSSKNRRLIGWDEILDVGDLPPSAIVQSWRGFEGAIRASALGHDVIVSPHQFVYFDYPQDEEHARLKPSGMTITTLEEVYSFQPTPPQLTADSAMHILGSECTMWTEHAPEDVVDIQLFPRLCAFSEVLWSPDQERNWDDFQRRLGIHVERLKPWAVNVWQR